MGNKPKEKLSDRLLKLFLTHVEKYDTRHFKKPLGFDDWEKVPPIWLATDITKYCMGIIKQYEPEDIE